MYYFCGKVLNKVKKQYNNERSNHIREPQEKISQ